MYDEVQKAEHYNKHPSGIECIDVIAYFDCCRSNALKYLWRAGHKGNDEKRIQDIAKAIRYCEFTERYCDDQNYHFQTFNPITSFLRTYRSSIDGAVSGIHTECFHPTCPDVSVITREMTDATLASAFDLIFHAGYIDLYGEKGVNRREQAKKDISAARTILSIHAGKS